MKPISTRDLITMVRGLDENRHDIQVWKSGPVSTITKEDLHAIAAGVLKLAAKRVSPGPARNELNAMLLEHQE